MSTLLRILTLVLAVGLTLLVGGGLLWYLAYGVDKGPPEQVAIAGLAAQATIRWGTQGDVYIRAKTERDAMTALGYAHGRRRAWSVALWRQAAAGRLGEWFGEPALDVDRLTRRLGMAARAQAAFERLSEPEQDLLRAYTDGLNAALQSPEKRLQQEFVLLDLHPEPWLPWHTLAVERLFAWLAVPPPAPEALSGAGVAVGSFYEADRALRQWLQLHGFENSVAWAARDSAGTHLFQRQVYGATALPFLQEIALQWEGGPSLQGASLPGTPFFPAGKSTRHAWALLLTSAATLERAARDSVATRLDYERLLTRDGAEHLAAFQRAADRLPLEAPGAAPSDSVWLLRWAGLAPQTDVAAWRGLLGGQAQPFALLQGNGLWMERTGVWRVLGAPVVEVPLPAGVFVGSTRWSAYAAELLRTQESGPVRLQAWIDDAYSIWAAQTAPPLIDALGATASEDAPLGEALTYLRNWDFSYDRASIAASLFDTWMAIYRHTTGALPSPSLQDTLPDVRAGYLRTFEQAVATLVEAFGPDQSQWRWERVRPEQRLFPVWSVEALGAVMPEARSAARYAPLDLPGHGHPSALAWGTSPVQHTLPAPAVWEAWIHTNTWETLTVRRRRLDPNALLGRYLLTDRPPDPLNLPGPAAGQTTTTLTPLSRPL